MKEIIVHSLSMPNIIDKKYFQYFLEMLGASFISLSKKNDVVLFCDEKFHPIIKKMGLGYKAIFPHCEGNRSVMACLDAMKYFHDEKAIFIDTDVISDMAFTFDKSDMIIQGIEYNNGWNLRNLHSFRQKYKDLVEKYYYNPEDHNLYTYNAGVIGFNHIELQEKYIQNWQAHIDLNLVYNPYLQYDNCFGAHVEQTQLYSIVEELRNIKVKSVQLEKKIIREYLSMYNFIHYNYFHPHGRYKHNPEIKDDIKKYIQNNDEKLFLQIKKICE